MAGLLAGSLGLAQALVMRREPRTRLRVDFPPPPGVGQLPVNDTPEVRVKAVAQWPQGERHFMAFFWRADREFDPGQYLQILMDQALPVTPVRVMSVRQAEFAGNTALEAERRVGKDESAVFAIIRMAVVDDYIAAFCLSGEGGMTDADRKFFDDYCTRQIRVRLERTR